MLVEPLITIVLTRPFVLHLQSKQIVQIIVQFVISSQKLYLFYIAPQIAQVAQPVGIALTGQFVQSEQQ